VGGGAGEGDQFVEGGANDSNEALDFNGRPIHAKLQCPSPFLSTSSLHMDSSFPLVTTCCDSRIWISRIYAITEVLLAC
jgi:hypothetical protein